MGLKCKDAINNIFLSVFRSNTERILNKKMQGFEKSFIFEDDLTKHYAHLELNEIASLNVLKGFTIDRINFIEENLGPECINNESFIDIGDPDGIFIKALGKSGYSANISEPGVKNIREKGIESILCDAESIPLKDNSIENVLFFEIFEHLPNPVTGLKELHRICRKNLILSIPHMTHTNIHRYNYCPEWFLPEHHIFEFDEEDFRKIVTHSGFKVEKMETYTVIGGGTIKERFVFLLWDFLRLIIKDPEYSKNRKDVYYGCFKKFDVYLLKK